MNSIKEEKSRREDIIPIKRIKKEEGSDGLFPEIIFIYQRTLSLFYVEELIFFIFLLSLLDGKSTRRSRFINYY